MKIDRLLSIIILLLNRDRVSAEELAARFEVTVRTIYRDMEAIGAAGIPLFSFPGKSGGYGILENYRIDRQVLNMDEILSIMSALRGAGRTFDDSQSVMALEKIRSLLPREGREKLELKSGQVVYDSFPWGGEMKLSRTIKTVYQAIKDTKLLSIVYRNWKEQTLTRVVEPLTLVFKGFSWYLFAFCRLRKDFRFFKLSRISKIVQLDESFEPRQADYRSYIKLGEEVKSGREFTLKFSGQSAGRLAEYFEPSLIETCPDGSAVVRINYPDQDWVIRFFLTFGEDLEVLEPESARKMMRKIAGNILKKYRE